MLNLTMFLNSLTLLNKGMHPGLVRFTLNSPTKIIEFLEFLLQFSTNFHEILHTLFSIHVVTTLKILISILEVRPFDM